MREVDHPGAWPLVDAAFRIRGAGDDSCFDRRMKPPPKKGSGGPVARDRPRDRPEPFHEHPHRWLIPDWTSRLRLPRNAGEWGYTALGVLIAFAAVGLLLRQAIAHPF